MLSIIKKELRDYFSSSVGYIVIVLFYIGISTYYLFNVFIAGQATMRIFFETAPIALLFVCSALSMRSFAEEKKEGTLELLTTLPIATNKLLLGKFLANLLLIIAMLLLTFPLPLTLNLLGRPDNGVIFTSYVGLIILAATYLSIGQLISLNSRNQIAAFLLTAFTLALLYLIGENVFLQLLPQGMQEYVQMLGLGAHFQSIAKGVLDTRDLFYYASVIVLAFMGISYSYNRLRIKGK
jgi:ABC-2 type transport system permease protein